MIKSYLHATVISLSFELKENDAPEQVTHVDIYAKEGDGSSCGIDCHRMFMEEWVNRQMASENSLPQVGSVTIVGLLYTPSMGIPDENLGQLHAQIQEAIQAIESGQFVFVFETNQDDFQARIAVAYQKPNILGSLS